MRRFNYTDVVQQLQAADAVMLAEEGGADALAGSGEWAPEIRARAEQALKAGEPLPPRFFFENEKLLWFHASDEDECVWIATDIRVVSYFGGGITMFGFPYSAVAGMDIDISNVLTIFTTVGWITVPDGTGISRPLIDIIHERTGIVCTVADRRHSGGGRREGGRRASDRSAPAGE